MPQESYNTIHAKLGKWKKTPVADLIFFCLNKKVADLRNDSWQSTRNWSNKHPRRSFKYSNEIPLPHHPPESSWIKYWWNITNIHKHRHIILHSDSPFSASPGRSCCQHSIVGEDGRAQHPRVRIPGDLGGTKGRWWILFWEPQLTWQESSKLIWFD